MIALYAYSVTVGAVFWTLLAGFLIHERSYAQRRPKTVALAAILIALVWPGVLLYFWISDKYIDKGRKP